MKKVIFCTCMIFILSSLCFTQGYWESLDGPRGGSVSSIVTDTISGIMYAGLSSKGLYRSTDNGDNWQSTNSIFDRIRVNALAIDTSGNMFAGTDSGAYNSTDYGDTWIQINEGLMYYNPRTQESYPLTITKLCYSQNGYLIASSNGRIFRSENNGESWDYIKSVSTTVTALAVSSNGYIFAATDLDSLQYSIDNGENWTTIDVDSNRTILDVAINTMGHIFVCTGKGVFRSTDDGMNWSNALPREQTSLSIGHLLIDSNDHVFAASGDFSISDSGSWIYRSIDNGDNWTLMTRIGTGIKTFACNMAGYLFAGTDWCGIYRSTDNGLNWHYASIGLPFVAARAFAVNSIGDVYTGISFGGMYGFTGSSDQWVAKNAGLMNCRINAIAIDEDDHIWAGTDKGIYYSTDNGNNWIKHDSGIPAENSIISLAAQSNDKLFACSYDDVFRSMDNGEHWINISSALSEFNCMTSDSSGRLFAGTHSSGIYRSEDNGDNWTKIDTGLTDDYISDICSNASGIIFAGTVNMGIFRSLDTGNHWEQINNGLTDSTIYCITINSSGSIFCGTASGVFVSTDNGDNWALTNTGLDNTEVSFLAVDNNDFVFACTPEGGVFRSIKPSTAIELEANAIPYSFKLEQNYPNPFNPKTVISWQLAVSSHVNISIYNILGQKVAILVNKKQPAGMYSIEFDGSNLASGLYFYQINASDFTQTKRMLLIK